MPKKTAAKAAKLGKGLKGDEPIMNSVNEFKANAHKALPVKTTASDETPEAQPTKAAKTAAAEAQFAKADAAGAPKRDPDEVAAEEVRVGLAARGY